MAENPVDLSSRRSRSGRPEPEAAPAEESARPAGAYPRVRMRRSRRHEWTRRLVSENSLEVADLIWPAFVHEGGQALDVPSMRTRITFDRSSVS